MSLGALIGIALSIVCNKSIWRVIMGEEEVKIKGINLDTLSYGSVDSSDLHAIYERSMQSRNILPRDQITLISPAEVTLKRIIGEGTFGRVWSAQWRSSRVAVKVSARERSSERSIERSNERSSERSSERSNERSSERSSE